MSTVTLFDLPSEVIIHKIYSHLPNPVLFHIRLTSKAALKSIANLIEASHLNITLDNEKVQIDFKGDFKTTWPAFLQHKRKMSALNAHPELLDVLATGRSEMQSNGHKGPFTVQSFINYSAKNYGVGISKYLILALHDSIEPIWLDSLPLALVPFDLSNPVLSVPHQCSRPNELQLPPIKNELLGEALIIAAEKNSLELVSLVLSHPNAKHLGINDLDAALKEAKPKDSRIKLAIDNHKRLYKKFSSPTSHNVHAGKVHFTKNCKKSLPHSD